MREERKIIKVVARDARYRGDQSEFLDILMKNFALRIFLFQMQMNVKINYR